MSDKLDATISITADTSGVEAGVDKTKKSLKTLGSAAQQAAGQISESGKAAGAGMDAIGRGSEQAAKAVERSTRSMQLQLQRQIAEMQAGGKATREYTEALARMRGVDVANLRPLLDQLDAARKKTDDAKKSAEGFAGGLASMKTAVAGFTAALAGGAVFARFIAESKAAEQEQAQLAAVLKSTGEAAGWSQAQLNKMADTLASKSTYSSGAINEAQTRLLSYTNIAGKEFPRAMQAVIDMSARMGMDVKSSAETIGRALDIPSEGLTALTRQGFRFTESQKELVKQLEATGRAGDAQAIILEALESSYGGAAEAARNTFGGALQSVQNSIGSLLTADGESMGSLTNSVNDLNSLLQSDGTKQAFAFYVELMVSSASAAARLAAALAGLKNGGIGAFLGHAVSDNAATELVSIETKIANLTKTRDGLSSNWWGRLTAADDIAIANKQLDAMQQQREVLLQYVNDGVDGYEKLGEANANFLAQQEKTAAAPVFDGLVASALEATKAYKSKAEQMAEVQEQGDKLRAALKQLEDGEKGASKEAKQLRERLRGVDERLASMAKSGTAGAAGLKNVESAYATLSKRVNEYISQLALEAKQGDKVTAAQKLQIQLDELLAKSKGKLAAAKVAGLNADIQSALSMEKEAAASKLAADQAEEAAKAYDSVLDATMGRTKSLADQVKAEEEAAAAIGLSKEAVAALEMAKLSDMAATIERKALLMDDIDLSGQQSAALRAEAQAYRDLASVKGQRAVRQATYDTAKKAEEDWKNTSKTIGDTLADYIMGGGKDAAQYLKRLFSTLVLQPIVQTAVGSIFGGAGGAQAMLGGGNGGVLGTASNLNSLYGAFSGGITSSIGGAIGSLGSMFGSSALTSFAAGIKGSTLAAGLAGPTTAGASGAMGLGASVGAALPWVAGALAVTSLFGGSLFGRKLKDSGIEGTFGGDQGFAGNTFEYYKGGLLRKSKTKRSPLDEVTRSQFADQFTGAQSSIKTMGDTLGLITDAVDGATYSIKLSLKGLSEADASKAIQAEFDRIAESMAGLVLVTNEYSIADENRIETLTRLSGSLTAFNGSLELLGLSAYDASLKSADAAYKIISAFGGLENYGQAIQGYRQDFYSEAERLEALQKQLRDTLTGLDLSIDPAMGEAAKRQYREAVEAAMAGGQGELAAQLLAMSGTFATAADAAQKSLSDIADAALESAAAAEALSQNLRSSLISLEAQFSGGGFARQYQAEDAAKTVQQLLGDAGISKDLGVLTQTLLSATSADVESYFREIWNVLPTDEAKQQLVEVAGSMLDLAAAAEAAAQAVAAERESLEQRWLQAIGDTAELRRRELEALDPSNRALLEMIYGLEDAKAGMNELANAAQAAAQTAAAAWQNWGTASSLGAQYLGDTSGLQARQAILNAQIAASTDPATRLSKLQELISIEQAIASAQQTASKSELEAINARQQALQKEISAAQKLLSAAQALGSYVDQLQTSAASGLSDQDRLSALGGQYSQLLGRARGGDADAMANLQGVSGSYLSLAQEMAVSSADYSVLSGRMAAELEAIAATGQASATSAIQQYENQMAQLTAQSDLLTAQVELSDSTKSLIAKSMLDQAEVWDRENTNALNLQDIQQLAADRLALMPDNIAKSLRPTLDGNATYLAGSIGGTVANAINNLAGLLGLTGSGSTPGFASGGLHAGGLRIVGERGWELEATGPSRIWNQQQLAGVLSGGGNSNGNAEVVAQLRELNRRIERLESHAARTADSAGGLYDLTDQKSEGGNADRVEMMNVREMAQAIAQAIKEPIKETV